MQPVAADASASSAAGLARLLNGELVCSTAGLSGFPALLGNFSSLLDR